VITLRILNEQSTVSAETAQKQIEAVVKWNGTCNKFPSQIIQPTLVLSGTEDVLTSSEGSLLLVGDIL
jgi:hypothetical protein